VRDLKRFLAYAERGRLALTGGVESMAQTELQRGALQRDVQDVLEADGWKVEPQLGCSGYRIDLAVLDPTHDDRFLVGIECDGENYAQALTARDRDKTRSAVLRGLGWSLLRVWSNDWLADREGASQKLLAVVRSIQDNSTQPSAAALEALTEQEMEAPDGERPESEEHLLRAEPRTPVEPEADPLEEVRAEPSNAIGMEGPRPYHALKRGRRGGSPESFKEAKSAPAIRRALVAIVEKEGPIGQEFLARRVASFWGHERFTARVSEHAMELLEECVSAGELHIDENGFVWTHADQPAACLYFRTPEDEADPEREVEDLAPQEVAAAALHLLRQHISVPLDDLVRQTAKLFGYPRAGSRMQAVLLGGIERLREHPDVEFEDQQVILK